MKMKRIVGFLAGAGLIASLAFVGPIVAKPGNKYANMTDARDCGDGDEVEYAGPLKLWPPNHKLVGATVTATDEGGDDVTLEIIPDVLDATGGDGGPNHDPDVELENNPAMGSGSATVDVSLRAERSGRGDGRTYVLDWLATFDNGAKECSSLNGQEPFEILVPHDMRGGADWKE